MGRQIAVLNKESGVDETLLLRGYKLLSDIALGKYPEGIQHKLVICTADGNTEAQFTSSSLSLPLTLQTLGWLSLCDHGAVGKPHGK